MWVIICSDFYELCEAFQQNNLCLRSLNGSHITFLPKFDNRTKASDFRPFSLLNCSMKFITKLLANRLQQIVHS